MIRKVYQKNVKVYVSSLMTIRIQVNFPSECHDCILNNPFKRHNDSQGISSSSHFVTFLCLLEMRERLLNVHKTIYINDGLGRDPTLKQSPIRTLPIIECILALRDKT